MKRLSGKTFGFTFARPIFFITGFSFLPKRLIAAFDCHTSITRQPPGTGPAAWASRPFTGQSPAACVALAPSP